MSGPEVVYALHGLRLRSAVPLGGRPEGGGGHDVTLTWTAGEPVPGEAPAGRTGAAMEAGGRLLYAAAVDAAGVWTLRVPGVCDFVVAPGLGGMECRVDPAADPELAAVLASGLAVSFLLGLAGCCVLHASAVETGGRARAFAGPSGAGKSTLAAMACAAGARLVADDVLRLDAGPPVTCARGADHLRLRPPAAWALDAFATRPEVVPTADGRLGVRPPVAAAPAVPLSVVVLPRLSRQAGGLRARRLTGAGAVAALAAATRIPGWTDPGVVRAQFRTLAAVAAAVPVVEAVVPWGSPAAVPIEALLEAAGA